MAHERWISLASGGGTTFEQMALAVKDGRVRGITSSGLIASEDGIGAIEKASALDIPHVVVSPKDFIGQNGRVDRNAYGERLWQVAHNEFGATFFTQNGHIPLTPRNFIQRMEEFGIGGFNQHPGNPVDFGGRRMYGRRVHAAVLQFYKLIGAQTDIVTTPIVQRVANDYDAGVVVEWEDVDVYPDDTVDSLQKRVLPVEHRLNIQLLEDISKGNIVEFSVESILKPGQELYLQEAKRLAALQFPQG